MRYWTFIYVMIAVVAGFFSFEMFGGSGTTVARITCAIMLVIAGTRMAFVRSKRRRRIRGDVG